MDANRFDEVTRFLSTIPSRRDVLRGLAAAGFGLGAPRLQVLQDAAEAKKKQKRKGPKKPKNNAFGCLDVGRSCRGNSANCCSGICQGKKPKKGKKDKSKCIGHNAGICAPSSNFCTVGIPAICNASNPNCTCVLTTGNAGFCGDFTSGVADCRVCSKDTDCQAEFGPGAACIVFGGICTEACVDGGVTVCVPPCA